MGAIIGGRGYGLETFPTNLPLLEAAVEVLEGKRPATEVAGSKGSISAAIRRAEAMTDASGKLTGSRGRGRPCPLLPRRDASQLRGRQRGFRGGLPPRARDRGARGRPRPAGIRADLGLDRVAASATSPAATKKPTSSTTAPSRSSRRATPGYIGRCTLPTGPTPSTRTGAPRSRCRLPKRRCGCAISEKSGSGTNPRGSRMPSCRWAAYSSPSSGSTRRSETCHGRSTSSRSRARMPSSGPGGPASHRSGWAGFTLSRSVTPTRASSSRPPSSGGGSSSATRSRSPSPTGD